jgi:hypothetical protein
MVSSWKIFADFFNRSRENLSTAKRRGRNAIIVFTAVLTNSTQSEYHTKTQKHLKDKVYYLYNLNNATIFLVNSSYIKLRY